MSLVTPSTLLPYGPDFLWVDELLETGSHHIITRTCYRTDNRLLRSHVLDGRCIVPGVILIEQASQTACLGGALLASDARDPAAQQRGAFMIGRIKAKFLAPAEAPCTVLARIDFRPGRVMIGFSARLSTDTRTVAEVSGLAVRTPR